MKFGLIGHPIEHSLSPALFKAGYGGIYPYDLIITENFEEAYKRFLEGYDGINVTAPFKELALRKADIISEECRLVGAANILIKTPQGITAYNSDFRGLVAMFRGLKGDEKRTPFATSSLLPPAARGRPLSFQHAPGCRGDYRKFASRLHPSGAFRPRYAPARSTRSGN